MKLLTTNQAKMEKSADFGYLSAVLHLEPALDLTTIDSVDPELLQQLQNVDNTCPDYGVCASTCIVRTGRLRFDSSEIARMRRTNLLLQRPQLFMFLLDSDIESLKLQAYNAGVGVTVRLNGTSDIAWERIRDRSGRNVFERHSDVRFCDYTKTISRIPTQYANYTLVYSYSERSDAKQVRNLLLHGGRVSMVFDVAKRDALPARYKIGGRYFDCVDGDVHDLLHLQPESSILALRYKKAFSDKTGRALKPNPQFVVSI